MTPPSLSQTGSSEWESDGPFRAMVEASPDLMWVNERGRLVYINPAGLELLGAKDPAEVLGRSPLEFISPEGRDQVRERIEKMAAQGGVAPPYRQVLLGVDGRRLPMEVRASSLRTGEDWAILVVFRDLSFREEADRERDSLLQRLERSEPMLRIACRMGRMGGWEFDLIQSRLTWSAEVFKIYELERQETPSLEEAIAFYEPECRDHVAEAVRRCSETGEGFEQTWRLVTAKGNRLWVRAAGEAVRDEEGRIVGLRGAFQDVTPQVEAESEASRTALQLERTLESISEAFFTLDRDWRFTFLNSEAGRLLRQEAGALLGRNVWEAFPDAAGTVAQQVYEAAMERGERGEFEIIFEPLDAWFEVRAYPVPEGIAVYFRDVTKQREARERIAEALTAARVSEERFRYVAQAISDAIWDWDMESDAVWWSDGLRRLFGYDPEEVEPDSRSWLSRIHPEDRERVERSIQGRIAGGGEHWMERYRFRSKDGGYVEVEDRGLVIRDPPGKALRMVGGMRDESQRRREEQRQMRAQRMEAIGTLAGGIAHDLNNILAPITMSIGILKANPATRPLRGVLDTIESSAARGASVVRQVLSFARGLEGERVSVDPRLPATEVVKMARETFPRSIRVESAFGEEEPWTVTGDATQLHQALLNLFLNARDAMPGGGTLRLQLENVELGEAAVSAFEWALPGRYVLLKVEDSGEGIPRELCERIFDPFFTTKEQGKGTGLGLAMVGTIARSHGGFVKVYSEEGKGSSFMLYLPARQEAELVAAEGDAIRSPARSLPKGAGELVLVVDDEEPIRKVTRQALEMQGYRVEEAGNGLEALSVYAPLQDDVKLIVTDMMMPEMDGSQLIAALAAMAPDVPIVAASGLHSKSGAAAVVPGASVTLAKPFSAERLLETVASVLGKGNDG